MKSTLLAPLLATALFAGTAGAETIQIDVPSNVRPAESKLTRTEVLADLQMSRLAGLQNFGSRGDQPVDPSSDEYRRALATYTQLRASPQFAALVQQLQQHPNAIVVAR